MRTNIFGLMLLVLLGICLSLALAQKAEPKVEHTDATPIAKPLDRADALELQLIQKSAENLVLQQQALQAQQASVFERVCKAAAFPVDECSIDLNQRVVTHTPKPPAQPEKKKP